MPSKAGRRTTSATPVVGPAFASRTQVLRSREEWDAAGFTVAEIDRPLRRGIDVERLNELSARSDALDSDEAEELYRYRLRRVGSRLRQLARARSRDDEESIRNALAELDARLADVGRLEDAREQS